MSEGSITYVDEGETCGIFTVINSELRNHKVCNDGLACMDQYFDITQDTTIKKCSSVELPPGTECNPLYTNCGGGLECLRNEFEVYTCGGCTYWKGNSNAINTKLIVTSHYEPNMTLVILGIIIILLDIALYIYVFHLRPWLKKKSTNTFYEQQTLVSNENI